VQPGDIALFRPHNWVGRAISVFTTSRYCHVRLIVDSDGSTVEADFGGAIRGRVQPGDVIVSPPLTPERRARIRAVAGTMVGIPYGFVDILALGLAQLGLRLPSLARRIARPDRLFCSQLVDLAWGTVGFEAFTDGRLPQDVSPGDLADLAFVSDWPTTVASANPSEGKAA
jgi:hypothetical protein